MALFNRTNPRFPMASEDTEAKGSAGASAPDPVVEKPEDPVLKMLNEMNQRIAQSNEAINARLQGVEQFTARFNQALEAQSQKRAADDLPPQVDEDTQRFVDEKLREINQGQMAVTDQLDAMQFEREVLRAKVDPRAVESALKVHGVWMQKGFTVEGRPLSRLDALDFVLGRQQRSGASADATNLPGAEENRREGNKHAITENGSRAAKGEVPKDPDKMTRQERINSYWPEVLDKEGF